jgi:predicted Zn-dependent protease with MMP-like domain
VADDLSKRDTGDTTGAIGGPTRADAAADPPDLEAGLLDPGGPADPEDAARDAFADLVWAAVEALPEPYASARSTVAFMTEDEALPSETPPGTIYFALYRGVPLTREGADAALDRPTIRVFRLPHERFFPDSALRARQVHDTVLHEVAHHLGIDEAGIRAIEAERRARGG